MDRGTPIVALVALVLPSAACGADRDYEREEGEITTTATVSKRTADVAGLTIRSENLEASLS